MRAGKTTTANAQENKLINNASTVFGTPFASNPKKEALSIHPKTEEEEARFMELCNLIQKMKKKNRDQN